MAVGERGAGGRPGAVPGVGDGHPQGGLAEPEQAGAVERDGLLRRSRRNDPSVHGGAVGGAEVADGDRAVLGEVQGEVQPRDVGVVDRDVGLAGAADPDLPAVQPVHAAGVGAADDAEFGGGGGVVRVVGGRVRLVEGEDGAVEQRGMAEQGVLVHPARPGVEVHMGGGPGPAHADGARERPREGAERGAHGCGDQHVHVGDGGAGDCRSAARSEDGQPDLHLARGPFCWCDAVVPLRGAAAGERGVAATPVGPQEWRVSSCHPSRTVRARYRI